MTSGPPCFNGPAAFNVTSAFTTERLLQGVSCYFLHDESNCDRDCFFIFCLVSFSSLCYFTDGSQDEDQVTSFVVFSLSRFKY